MTGILINDILTFVFARDDLSVLFVDSAGVMCTWDLMSHQETSSINLDVGMILAIEFSADRDFVQALSESNTVHRWKVATAETVEVHKIYDQYVMIECARFSPDLSKMVAYLETSSEGETEASELLPGTNMTLLFTRHEGEEVEWVSTDIFDYYKDLAFSDLPEGYIFSADSTRMAATMNEGFIRIWDTSTGQTCTNVRMHQSAVIILAISPDGSAVASASTDQSIRLWKTEVESDFKGFNKFRTQRHLDLSAENGLAFTVSTHHGFVVRQASTGRVVYDFTNRHEQIETAMFSPDGSSLAALTMEQSVKLWSMSSGYLTYKLDRPGRYNDRDHTSNLIFSYDNRLCLVTRSSRYVDLWEASTGTHLHKFRLDEWPIYNICMSDDRSLIAAFVSSSHEKARINVFKVNDAEVSSCLEVDGRVETMVFSHNGQLLAYTSRVSHGSQQSERLDIRVLNLPEMSEMAYFCANSASRSLTFSSCDRFVKIDHQEFDIAAGRSSKDETSIPAPCIEMRDHWIRVRGEDILWLREEPYHHVVRGKTLVLSRANGEISVFECAAV